MTRSRQSALDTAVQLVGHFDAACVQQGRAMVAAGDAVLSAPAALKRELAMAIVGHLSASPPASNGSLSTLLYPTKRRLQSLAIRTQQAPRARAFLDRATEADVLVVPRADNHLRDVLPVARALAARGVPCRFLTFRPDHGSAIHAAGFEVIDARALGGQSPRRALTCAAEAASVAFQLARAPAPAEVTEAEWRTSLMQMVRALSRELEPAMVVGDAIRKEWSRRRPALALLGNPSTAEARMVLAAAESSGTPTLCIQHGEIVAGDPFWRGLAVSQVCAWGTRSAEALASSGVDPARICVTGAPWVDGLAQRTARAPGRTAMFLVALSGAGHMVGEAEHAATVDTIFDTADRLP